MIKLNGKRKHYKMNHKQVKILESYSSKKRTLTIFKKKGNSLNSKRKLL